jgi:hypothetical protein
MTDQPKQHGGKRIPGAGKKLGRPRGRLRTRISAGVPHDSADRLYSALVDRPEFRGIGDVINELAQKHLPKAKHAWPGRELTPRDEPGKPPA